MKFERFTPETAITVTKQETDKTAPDDLLFGLTLEDWLLFVVIPFLSLLVIVMAVLFFSTGNNKKE